MSYGFGLQVGEMEGRRKISHGGGINGFRSQLAWYPDDDLAVVVLTNSGSASPGTLESAIARAVLGIPERVVEEVPMSAEELETYAGIYDAGRSPIAVMLVDGELRIFGRRLRAVGGHEFRVDGDAYRTVTFDVVGGRARSLRMEREGQVTTATRAGESGSGAEAPPGTRP
ncbi:MAG: hypothetical protein R3190_13660, partial [Thermoanaerobaculia bacterium]|nr:hypothetical protein [Thermoanaerobaculia bacterium]